MSEPQEVRTRNVFWAAAWLFCAIFIPGVAYWIATRANVSKCLYGDPACSLTLATYLLSFLTLAAFLAAYRAARYAQQAIEIEREVTMALEQCTPFVLSEQASQANVSEHSAYRTEELFMSSIDGGFQRVRPVDFSRLGYIYIEFDCMSVGRSPIVNGEVKVKSRSPSGNVKDVEISVGSIPTDKFIHLKLWVNSSLEGFRFSWLQGKVSHKKGRRFEFFSREDYFDVPFVSQREEVPAEPTAPDPISL